LSDSFDVIVLGAGPAGSSCARRAAELGLSVAVLEKADFPRPKPCAAGLTEKAMLLLGDDLDPVRHRRFRSAEIAFDRYLSLMVSAPDDLVATTTRRELDAQLARSADAAGARIEHGRVATGLDQECGVVRVRAGTDTLTAGHVVVCDGARGAGRSMLGLDPLRMGGGLYVRARPGAGELPDDVAGRLLFDPTAVRRGYGWIFPKRDHLNIGVFSQRELHGGLRRALDTFLVARGFDGWRTEGPFAFPIPVRRPQDALGTGRVLFAGDAAGLVNPVTGEGISSAVLSGRLAAEAISRTLGTDHEADRLYAQCVAQEVIPMIDGSRRNGDLAYGLGPGFLKLAARTPFLRSLVGPAWRAATEGYEGLTMKVVVGGAVVGQHGGDA
jgi:geranylgeranyl reductase family protein